MFFTHMVEKSTDKRVEKIVDVVTVAEMVDQYVDAKRRYDAALKELEPLKEHVTNLKTELVEEADREDASEKVVLEGHEHTIEFGPKANKVTNIDLKRLQKILSKDEFLQIVKVSPVDVRKYLTHKAAERVLTVAREGYRRMKII